MKVLLVNNSDSLGGAAIASYRLLRALINAGVDARMLVMTKTGNDHEIAQVELRFSRALSFGLERAQIAMNNGFNRSNLFKVSTGHFAMGIASHPWVKGSDIICLNWINQGLVGIKDLYKLHKMGKKIIWTMHDMWCMTGICHHAFECAAYTNQCGDCQFLGGSSSPSDLSHRVWKEKKAAFSKVPITFVAISSWLARKAKESLLLRDQRVETIPNAFPAHLFPCHSDTYIKSFNREETPNVILFGAARIDDPIKGLDYAIDALNLLFDNEPEVASKSVAIFFGNLRDVSKLDRLRFSHIWIGMVNDFKILRHLYSCARVVLSTSLYETSGNTLIEGQAGGCLPVTFGQGGQNDIVEHKKNGYIADYLSPQSVAEGILWAVNSNISRDELHQSVVNRFSAEEIARQYIELFKTL